MNNSMFSALLLALSCFTVVHAQTPADSLRRVADALPADTNRFRVLTYLFDRGFYNNETDALAVGREALRLAENLHFTAGAIESWQMLGRRYTDMGRYDSAQICLNQALHLAEKTTAAASIAESNYLIGYMLAEKGDLDAAAQTLLTALRQQEQCCGERSTVGDLQALCTVYLKMQNHQQAQAMAERGLALCKKYDLPADDRVPIQSYLSQSLFKQGRAQEGLRHIDEVIAYIRTAGREDMLPVALAFRGDALFALNRHAEAARAYADALALPAIQTMPLNMARMHNKLANALLLSGRTSEAWPHLQQGMQIAQEFQNPYTIADNLSFRMHYFMRNCQPDSAWAYFDRFMSMQDSLYNLDQAEAIHTLQVQYETEKKDKEILLRQAEVLRLERQNWLAFGSAGLLLLLLAAAWLSYRQRRRHLEAEAARLLAEQKADRAEAARLSDELDSRNRELTTFTLQLAKRNELLQELRDQVGDLGDQARSLQSLIRQNLNDEQDWEQFRQYFERVHPDFIPSISAKFPQLSNNDLRLLCLIQLNLSNKEIAAILHVEPASVITARYRMKKKMEHG